MSHFLIGLDLSPWGVLEVKYRDAVTDEWVNKESATQYDTQELAQSACTSEIMRIEEHD